MKNALFGTRAIVKANESAGGGSASSGRRVDAVWTRRVGPAFATAIWLIFENMRSPLTESYTLADYSASRVNRGARGCAKRRINSRLPTRRGGNRRSGRDANNSGRPTSSSARLVDRTVVGVKNSRMSPSRRRRLIGEVDRLMESRNLSGKMVIPKDAGRRGNSGDSELSPSIFRRVGSEERRHN